MICNKIFIWNNCAIPERATFKQQTLEPWSSTLKDDEDVDDNVRLVAEDNDNIEAFFRRLVSDP